jgi:hypothetical protein
MGLCLAFAFLMKRRRGQVPGNSAFGVAAVWLTAFGYVVASVDIRGGCEGCTMFGWGKL